MHITLNDFTAKKMNITQKDINLFDKGLQILEISLTGKQREQLLRYCSELHHWNKKINLIAKNTSLEESLEKHFLDSLTLKHFIEQYGKNDPSLLDIGTGAGFPGLVLKIACPTLGVTLVEPRSKRCTFLRHMTRTLQLDSITLQNSRLEDCDEEVSDKTFSFITSRALMEPEKFIALTRPVTSPGSHIILMLSQKNTGQWITGTIQEDFTVLEQKQFKLPFSKATRLLVLLQKVEPDPAIEKWTLS